jgi:hypothetical protein
VKIYRKGLGLDALLKTLKCQDSRPCYCVTYNRCKCCLFCAGSKVFSEGHSRPTGCQPCGPALEAYMKFSSRGG